MSSPRPVHLGRFTQWAILVFATVAILYLTIGLAPADWRSSPTNGSFNLKPFRNLSFVVGQFRAHQLFTGRMAYEILSFLGNVGLFWCWAFVALHTFSPSGRRSAEAVFVTVLLGIGLSVGIESLQIFLPERSADIDDILANSLGALLGAFHALLRRGIAIEWD